MSWTKRTDRETNEEEKTSKEFWFILNELNALYEKCCDSLIFPTTNDHSLGSLFEMIDFSRDSSFREDSLQKESVLKVR